jgi:hypothetical protein
MANEVNWSVSLSANKNGAGISGSGSNSITMSGDTMIENVQTVGTSAELIVLEDVDSPSQILLKNLDATNYVEIALDSGMTNKFAKLLPGEALLIRPSSATLYARANTAACNVLVVAPNS